MSGVMTIPQFIAHLSGFNVRHAAQQHSDLEKAAKVVQAEARHEIGTYQGQAGPFSAWPELADSTKDDRVRKGFSENYPLLRTGELRDSIDYAIGKDEAVVGSSNDKAVWQELGTNTIPPRSFLGGAAFRKVPEIVNILGQSVVAALIGNSVVQGGIKIK